MLVSYVDVTCDTGKIDGRYPICQVGIDGYFGELILIAFKRNPINYTPAKRTPLFLSPPYPPETNSLHLKLWMVSRWSFFLRWPFFRGERRDVRFWVCIFIHGFLRGKSLILWPCLIPKYLPYLPLIAKTHFVKGWRDSEHSARSMVTVMAAP